MSSRAEIRDLEDQVLLLKHDIKWRDQLLKEQKKSNEELMEEFKTQARYIGHLEANVTELGGQPDQTYLAAPALNFDVSEGIEDTPEMATPEIISNETRNSDQPFVSE